MHGNGSSTIGANPCLQAFIIFKYVHADRFPRAFNGMHQLKTIVEHFVYHESVAGVTGYEEVFSGFR